MSPKIMLIYTLVVKKTQKCEPIVEEISLLELFPNCMQN